MSFKELPSKQPYEYIYRPEKNFSNLDLALDTVEVVLQDVSLPQWEGFGFHEEGKNSIGSWETCQNFLSLYDGQPDSAIKAREILDRINIAIAPLIPIDGNAPRYTRVKILTASLYGIAISDIFETKNGQNVSFLDELDRFIENPENIDTLLAMRENRLDSLRISPLDLEEHEDLSPRKRVIDACNELFYQHRIDVISQNLQSENVNTQRRYQQLGILHNLMQQKEGDTIFPSFSVRLQQGFSTGIKAPRMVVEGIQKKITNNIYGYSVEQDIIADPVGALVAQKIKDTLQITSIDDLDNSKYLETSDLIEITSLNIACRSQKMITSLMGEHLGSFSEIINVIDESQGWNQSDFILVQNELGQVHAEFIETEKGEPAYMELVSDDVNYEDTAITGCPARNLFAGSEDFNSQNSPKKRAVHTSSYSAYTAGQLLYQTILETFRSYEAYQKKISDKVSL